MQNLAGTSTSSKEGPLPSNLQGVGLRASHYSYILENLPKVGWFEAITENYLGIESGNGGRPLQILEKIREHYPLVLHGVSLSIGSTDPLNFSYLRKIKTLYERIEPLWVSDHFCWTGVGLENLHDLLPLPYTQDVIHYLVQRISQVQDYLQRSIIFENVSSYLSFQISEMSEWDFISEIARRSGCGILLDINNIFVSSVNHGFSPTDYIQNIPIGIVKQFHLSGHTNLGTHLIDTHDQPICNEVWQLYRSALKRFGSIPTLVEWDDQIPDFLILYSESQKATEIMEEALESLPRKSASEGSLRYSEMVKMDHY